MISKSNKRGVILIALLALIIIYTPRILMSLRGEDEFIVKAYANHQNTDTLKKSYQKKNYHTKQYNKTTNNSKKLKFRVPPVRFNPNNYSSEDWLYLGLSEKQTEVILKFLKSGIRSNEGLKKIYVLPKELYELIKDSTYYNQQPEEQKELISEPIFEQKSVLELNNSEMEDLVKIKGIGNFFANQIIKRRIQLGGYYSKEQLLEVWKLDTTVYNKIESNIKIDTFLIDKIDLNTVSKEKLQKHPYFNWGQANSIVQIRKQKGKFEAINDILQSKLISDSLYQKVKPYLKVK